MAADRFIALLANSIAPELEIEDMCPRFPAFVFHYRTIGTRNGFYSARNASTGFTEAARRAGRKLAISAERPRTAATATSVGTSQDWMPKSSLRISVVAASELTRPARIPASVSQPASFRINRYTLPG